MMNRRSFLLGSALAVGAPDGPGQTSDARPASAQFHLGCVTYNLLKDASLETLIQILEAAGITAVELRTGRRLRVLEVRGGHGAVERIGTEVVDGH